MQDDELDRLLAVVAKRTPVASEELMERVLGDALALQPQELGLRRTTQSQRSGLFARLAGALGGPPALAGLGTAAVFGLALGYLSPTTLDYLTGASVDSAEFFPEADFLTTEG